MSPKNLLPLIVSGTFVLSLAVQGRAQVVDSTPPQLTITSHTDGQTVETPSITLAGTATDNGRGNNGIVSVTVDGMRASTDTAVGSQTANWTLTIFLNYGANPLTVVATDGSGAQNSAKVTLTISSTASPTAATSHIFPQFADGRSSDGTYYRSTLMISNRSDSIPGNCTLRLRGLTRPDFNLNYSLVPGGWVISATSGKGALQSGYATLECNVVVDAQLLYSYYAANGIKIAEATVFSSPPAPILNILSDGRENAQLGIAIANDTDRSVTYSVSVRAEGNLIASVPVAVAARSSVAQFLNQLVPGIPTNVVSLVSVLSPSANPASIIGLRYTGDVFTTIPATTFGGVGGLTSVHHVFPEFADGRSGDGTYYRTARMVSNPNATANVDCTTRLHGMTTDGVNTFAFSVNEGRSVVFAPTRGGQAIQTGYATTDCGSAVYAQALYSYYAPNGIKLSEATVFSSPSAQRVQILADQREDSRVGLAIANDSEQSNLYTINFYDVSGLVIASASQSLSGHTSVAKFIDDFAVLPANYYGKVIVSSNTGGTASIIGLRYTGNVFTTIPEIIK